MTMNSAFFPNSPLGGLPIIKDVRSKRESSYDKTGGNKDYWVIGSGEIATIADIGGAGCIKHIWMTGMCSDKYFLRKVVMEMYWDGEENPSVRVPLGDFFGVGHGYCNHYTSLPMSMVFAKDRRGPKGTVCAALNCYFPMPFAKGATIKILNESDRALDNFFFMIDYESYDEPLPDCMGYFHACFNHENPCKKVEYPTPADSKKPSPGELPGKNLSDNDNYVVLDATGKGHYVGCVLSIDNIDATNQHYSWPGEGDDMIFIDGEPWPPSLHGTGTEDYFNAAWGFPSGEYAGPYHGVTLLNDRYEYYGKMTAYRWHIEDPVHFKESIRVSFEHGHANDQGNEYSSVAFWYQSAPHKPLSELEPAADRCARSIPLNI